VRKLERLCDAAVALESFSGSSKYENSLYQDYHGVNRTDNSDLLYMFCRSVSYSQAAMP